MQTKDPVLMQKILEFVNEYYKENGESPSLRVIADGVGSNRNSVRNYLLAMNECGVLSYDGRRIRTEAMDKVNFNCASAGIVGSVSCGLPEFAEQYIDEFVQLPVSIFGADEKYILNANGDSMKNAGIDDGDYVVVRKTDSPQEGDIVVALVDGATTTLKRYYYDEEHNMTRLHPENKKYKDILTGDCVIQGVAEFVIKALR